MENRTRAFYNNQGSERRNGTEGRNGSEAVLSYAALLRYLAGAHPILERKAAANRLALLKPVISAICAMDRFPACSRRMLCAIL